MIWRKEAYLDMEPQMGEELEQCVLEEEMELQELQLERTQLNTQ